MEGTNLRERRALIVGIEKYIDPEFKTLPGCVAEGQRLGKLLEKHGNDEPNFPAENISYLFDDQATQKNLKRSVRKLLTGNPELALFYFSGHGAITEEGGKMVTHDGAEFKEGMLMNELIHLSRLSDAENIILIIDSCHSGAVGLADGSFFLSRELARIPEKVSIISASDTFQTARIEGGRSIFTHLLCKGLEGEAKDSFGRISITMLYDYIFQRLNKENQTPQLKLFQKRSLYLRSA